MKRDSIILGFVGIALHVALLVMAVMLIRQYAVKCYDLGYRVFKEPPVTQEGTPKVLKITIADGVSPKAIGDTLESKGLIRDSNLFVLQYYCSEYREEIKAGTYELDSSMTAEDMFATMAGYVEEEEE
ncbi:MAG: endolytic transglycosylase MltG [Lachnospiraceae bacterium]|nr:endolytic transglycosylase MltG [Lachnospiraceae bacterium]